MPCCYWPNSVLLLQAPMLHAPSYKLSAHPRTYFPVLVIQSWYIPCNVDHSANVHILDPVVLEHSPVKASTKTEAECRNTIGSSHTTSKQWSNRIIGFAIQSQDNPNWKGFGAMWNLLTEEVDRMWEDLNRWPSGCHVTILSFWPRSVILNTVTINLLPIAAARHFAIWSRTLPSLK